MYRKDGERDMRYKENKDWASILMVLAYIFIIVAILYLGWEGIFKVFSPRENNDNRPLIASGVHSLILIILLICGVATSGDTQEWFADIFMYSLICSIAFTVFGFILNIMNGDK